MAFWNRKKERDTVTSNFAPVDQESFQLMITAMEKMTETIESNAKIVRDNTRIVSKMAEEVKRTRKP
jgi:methyl-accepting chemotaxis protein